MDKKLPMDGATIICRFEGEFLFLSNFYIQKEPIFFDGSDVPFYSVESAFQCAKYRGPHVRTLQKVFSMLPPDEAKHLGRALKLSNDWEHMRVEVMRDFVRKKFQIPYLRDMLLETGNAQLIEGNTWHDTFWGMCACNKHRYGENMLGKILTEVRKELREQNKE